MKNKIHLSIVSHGQGAIVLNLLNDLKISAKNNVLVVTLTLNIDETLPFDTEDFPFPIRITTNTVPKGFGENHNSAFHKFHDDSYHYCVINPDIRFYQDPFSALILCLKNTSASLVAPLVLGESGEIEDSIRHFPTPLKILCKVIGRCKGGDYEIYNKPVFPDWVGGMFMLFPSDIFKQLGGFNEKYFLYYEDVDLCARLRLRGHEVVACPEVKVIHEARRDSHRRFKYLKWHLVSMARFFSSTVFIKISCRKLTGRIGQPSGL